jgi:hypothetical protein
MGNVMGNSYFCFTDIRKLFSFEAVFSNDLYFRNDVYEVVDRFLTES